MKKRSEINIVIGGEAGQGLVTVGDLLAKALVRSGYSIVVTQSYQSRIRGGHNTYAVRAAVHQVEAPAEEIDLLVALNAESVDMHAAGMADGGLVVTDESFRISGEGILAVPFEEFGGERVVNISALGLLCALLGIDRARAAELVVETFGRKHPEAVEANERALIGAYEWARERRELARPLADPPAQGRRLMLNGNQAIALGAVSAGLRVCTFYPMTPATSVPLTLIGMAERMGLVVEQVEDEIAAINAAIGASFAGAPAMVATSGGGFALMVEGVSLAGMTETPVVVVVAQRPGPATGLPTRTEQADLEFVLRAGHGEFPRAIFAPGTVEQCFHLTRRAFELAELHQGPVFLLTDQFLADSSRAVEPFDVEKLDDVRPGADPSEIEGIYLRHAVTASGVSPRLLPGSGGHLVVTDSDEHTADGHLTEDLAVRIEMVDKRLRKARGLEDAALAPTYEGGDDPDLLLVCWGSTRGSVREAAARLRKEGEQVATMHFSQVWPLVPQQFLPRLEGARRVVSVEGNATGQLARVIRSVTGFDIAERILRYDGLPITPAHVLHRLRGEDEPWRR